MDWHIDDTKKNFEDILQQANKGSPQRIFIGKDTSVVVISSSDYEKLLQAEDEKDTKNP
jgi:hypothetical protein